MKFFASGLLFDNDGVLVDSHAAAAAAWAIWCAEYAPHIDWNSPENAGQRAEDKVREWIASADLFEVANNRIYQLEQDSAHETVALAGAVQLLTSLPANTWTVCTSANPHLGTARLIAAGCCRHVQTSAGTGPAHEAFARALAASSDLMRRLRGSKTLIEKRAGSAAIVADTVANLQKAIAALDALPAQ